MQLNFYVQKAKHSLFLLAVGMVGCLPLIAQQKSTSGNPWPAADKATSNKPTLIVIDARSGTPVIVSATTPSVVNQLPAPPLDGRAATAQTGGVVNSTNNSNSTQRENGVAAISVSGTVFDDGTGLADNAINGTTTNTILNALLINLVNTAGNVVAIGDVQSNGTYTIGGVDNGTYTLRISPTAGTVGLAAPATTPPTGYAFTGEGPTAGGDGTVNGSIAITVNNANLTGYNFGLDALPVGSAKTLATQQNPGGNTQVTIPAANFTATDLEDAPTGYANNLSGRTVRLTNITNGTLYFSGFGFGAGQTVQIIGFNPAVLSFDPADGNITGSFTYSIADNANQYSVPATISIPFGDPIVISGTVFNDGNGGTPDGTATGIIGGNTLYAVLLNGTTVVSRKAVSASNGTYSFSNADGVVSGGNYTLVVTNGNTATTPTLAAGTAYVSESDGSANGSITITNITDTVDNRNFGIDILPVVNAFTFGPQANPGGNNRFPVPASTFTGSDAEDAPSGYPNNLRGRFIQFTNFTNGSFYYRGSTATQSVSAASFDPNVVTFDPIDGNVTSSFQYRISDNANQYSAPVTVTIPFITPVVISGTVFNDGNGGTPDGRATGVIGGNTLYAVLLNGTTVVSRKAVDAGAGTYSFNNADGVVYGNTYNLIITNGNTATTPTLAAGTVYVSESDGSANGNITITNITDTVDNRNFGIDILPVTNAFTFGLQPNPGGSNRFKIPVSTFTGSDAEDAPTGYPNNLRGRFIIFTGFTNGLLYYKGSTATQSISDFNFDPDQAFFDPTDGNVTSSFQYRISDNANQLSAPVTVTIPFRTPVAISGTVFNDGNGGTPDGRATGIIGSNTLFAVLLNGTTVVSRKAVDANNGTYSFGLADGIVSGNTYNLIVTNGNTATTPVLAAGTAYVSESDGSANGNITITNITDTVDNQNFGIDILPTVFAATLPLQLNPGGNNRVPVPASTFTGSDPEDAPTGYPNNLRGRFIQFTNFTNGSFYYRGSTATQSVSAVSFDPDAVTFDPIDGNVTSSFQYRIGDNANQLSAPVTITLPFRRGIPIAGNIWNDVNGNANKETTETAAIPSPLYANIVNASGTVEQSLLVASSGNYASTSVFADSTYSVIITNTAQTTGATLSAASMPPAAGWVYTGVNPGATTATANPGNQTGVLAVATAGATDTIRNRNFGVERIPLAIRSTLPSADITTPPIARTIPDTAFRGSDFDGGRIDSLRITAFPTNTQTLIIGGTSYTAASPQFTSGNGVSVATNTAGNPVATIQVIPVAITTAFSVSIPYVTVDNAGRLSAASATVVAPYAPVVLPTPFNCTPAASTYVIGFKNGTNCTVAPYNVYTMSLNGTLSTSPLFTTPDTIEVNGIGINSADSRGYALWFRRDNNATPNSCINDTIKLIRFGANGNPQLLGYIPQPSGYTLNTALGTMGTDGAYYFGAAINGQLAVGRIANVASLASGNTALTATYRTVVNACGGRIFADWAFNPATPNILYTYGISINANNQIAGVVMTIDLNATTPNVVLSCVPGTETTGTFTNLAQDNLGGILFGSDGQLYGINVSDRKYYRINPVTGALALVSTFPASGSGGVTSSPMRTDAASCVTVVPTPTPFDCTPSKATYVISYKNGTNCTVASANVYTMDLMGNVSPTPLFTTADTIEVNALGLSRIDGKGYGMMFRRVNNNTPNTCVNDTLKFFRFGANGVTEVLGYLIPPAGSPSLDLNSALGTMDANGNYYFATFANQQLYTAKIERTDTLTANRNRSISFSARAVSINCFRNFSDWAINPTTGQLVSYGIYINSASQVAGSMVNIDLNTSTLSCYGIETTGEFTNAGQDNMGGIMFGTDASMYAVNSYTRRFYKINPNTGAIQFISTIPYGTTATIRTDMASCVSSPSILPLGFEKPAITSLGECRAELSWKVSGVEAGDELVVEKSYDGINFTTLTILKATTTGASSYSVTDGKTGITNYYRIKGVSRNGEVKYSPVVRFLSSCGGKNNVTLYQNLLPMGQQVAGEISLYKTQTVTATIYSAAGATLFSKTNTTSAGISRFSYNLPALAKGVYLLQTIIGNERFTEKFVVQ